MCSRGHCVLYQQAFGTVSAGLNRPYKRGVRAIGDIGECRVPNQSKPPEAAILLRVSYCNKAVAPLSINMYSLPYEYYFGWAFMAWPFFCTGLDVMPRSARLALRHLLGA